VTDSVLLAVLDSRHGPIHAAATDEGVCALAFRTTTAVFTAGLSRMGVGLADPSASAPPTDPRRAHLDRLAAELAEYWSGDRRRIAVPLDLRVSSAWDRRILEAVGTIGYGETLSYGCVAARAGAPRAARAAGGAVGRNPISLLIPCHRVIAGDGSLGGYGGSWFGEREELLALKRALLAAEGVTLRG
jgi:methylated-DNA-[protein]-cysteine S-methyltransferase